MSEDNRSKWVYVAGGIAALAAITTAGYVLNKLQGPESEPESAPFRDERELNGVPSYEASPHFAQSRAEKANARATQKQQEYKKMAVLSKLERLIKDLEAASRTGNRVLMKRPVDDIQRLVETSYPDGISDPDVIYSLAVMYNLIGDLDQQEKCLLRCTEKYEKFSLPYSQTCHKLVSLCTARQKFAEANHWAREYLQSWLDKKEKKAHFTSNEHFELACAHSGLAITSGLIGKFAEAHEHYNIALTIFYERSKIHDLALATIKNYFANFLYHGEFDQAIAEGDILLEKYEGFYKEVTHPGEKKKFVEFIVKLNQAFGDQFQNREHLETALKYFERGIAFAKAESLPTPPLQTIVDAANIYWELGKGDLARERESELLISFENMTGFHGMVPLSYSKYFRTTFAVLQESYYYLKLQLLGEIEKPRQEGEMMPGPKPRNLVYPLTLSVTFQDSVEGTFIQQYTLEQGQTEIVIQSKSMAQAAAIFKFYKVEIAISESGKEEPIGYHHQLVLSPRPGDLPKDLFL